MKTLFKNIKELIQVRKEKVRFVAGKDMDTLPTIKGAYLLISDGLIEDFGSMENCPTLDVKNTIDARGKMVLPAYCDSHTHLVYSGNRESEFIDRIKGLTYQEIAEKGGGILNSALQLQNTSEEDLYQQSKLRLEEVISMGTGAIEIKSGYGLNPSSELKMLRVIKKLREEYPTPIKATCLIAHALPADYSSRKDEYIQMMLDEILPIVSQESLAEYIDVFCETGYFSTSDTEKILKRAADFGLVPKVHVNQFNAIGGVEVAVKYNALSVDHLEILKESDISALKNSSTMPVALPNCSYFLSIPYTPARRIIDAGLPLALATDYNPGSSPSGNMNQLVAAACIKMSMTPEEAFNAATLNGAYAMGLENEVGSISIGKKANILLTKPINSYHVIPYSFGTNCIEAIFLNGEKMNY